MRDEWIDHCMSLATRPADFYSGCRKIHRAVQMTYSQIDDSLSIEDAGFTKTKLTLLRKLYHSDEHAAQVAALWRRRVEQDKYGSVGMSTYHHLTKSDPMKKSKRASVMGPCMMGVTATLMNDSSVGIDVFYRTSEAFKKFPADLVHVRDVVLPSLGVEGVESIRCHFASITSHPMYVLTWMALVDDVPQCLEEIRQKDEFFWRWCVKWSARYLCDEYAHGIQKFAQALRVAKDARARITGKRLTALQKYLRKNHPGYTHTRFEEDGSEE